MKQATAKKHAARKPAARKTGSAKKAVGKLVIFGVGLIGGSFALALKQKRAVGQVVGVGRTRANLLAAKRLGIIDEIATDPAAAVRDADLVLLAVPLAQNAAVLASIAPHIGAKTIVTDAGSTKRDIIKQARRHLGDKFRHFVPAHPIAGTEKSGAQAAFAELYRDHELIITAERETDSRAIAKVAAAWRIAGMRINRWSVICRISLLTRWSARSPAIAMRRPCWHIPAAAFATPPVSPAVRRKCGATSVCRIVTRFCRHLMITSPNSNACGGCFRPTMRPDWRRVFPRRARCVNAG